MTFLGTSSAAPTRDRGLPSIALRREGEVVLLDCGEGVQRRMVSESIGLGRDMSILITHLHGDHVSGLLGLLQTMSMAQRKKPVKIVGPKDLLRWLEVSADILHVGLTFPILFTKAKPGIVLRTSGFRVRATRATHSVEAFSYLIEELQRPGIFHPEKAKVLGVPEGELWSRLQRGRPVIVGKRKIEPAQVTGPRRPGRKIGYSGDTRPTKSLVRFFKGSDLLIFDSTFRGADMDKAVDRKHSTSVEAARVAKEAGVRRLVLTHFSARYPKVASLVREARRVFPATFAASDGLSVEVSYRSE